MWYFLSAMSHMRSNIFTIISTVKASKCLHKTSVLLTDLYVGIVYFFPRTMLIFWVQTQKIRPLVSSLTQSTMFLLWRTDSAMSSKYTVKLPPLFIYLHLHISQTESMGRQCAESSKIKAKAQYLLESIPCLEAKLLSDGEDFTSVYPSF